MLLSRRRKTTAMQHDRCGVSKAPLESGAFFSHCAAGAFALPIIPIID